MDIFRELCAIFAQHQVHSHQYVNIKRPLNSKPVAKPSSSQFYPSLHCFAGFLFVEFFCEFDVKQV
jgi:hypothetical protein